MAVLLACVFVLVLAAGPLAQAQGLPRDPEGVLAASNSAKLLSAYLQRADQWRRQLKLRPSGACNTAPGSLCAPRTSEADEGALHLASSPAVFDLRSLKATDGFSPLTAVQDQGDCNTCTAFAVGGAAEIALAMALKKDATAWFSPQDFYFCSSLDPGTERQCGSSWTIEPALAALVKQAPTTPSCLPYEPRAVPSCRYRCNSVNPDVLTGKFLYSRLTSEVDMQRWMRTNGPVLTGMQVHDGLLRFLAATPDKIYNGPSGTEADELAYGHAVVLVGYDNVQRSWLVRSSWGTKVGDQGYFRVAYGASGIADPSKSWGLRFQPFKPVRTFEPSQVAPAADKPACYSYRASKGDYVSKVASMFSISIKKLLLDNIDTITDPAQLLGGKGLLVCTSNVANFLPPSSQADALLRIKSAVDPNDRLARWVVGPDAKPGAYCAWPGIECDNTNNVVIIRLRPDTLGQGPPLGGVLPDVEALLALPQLRELTIWQQEIAGTLPNSYAKLTRIGRLDLAGNKLRGTLPASWSAMAALEAMALGAIIPADESLIGNLLEGTLPPEWGSMKHLSTLTLPYNRLTGPLPAAWGKLRLTFLQLGANMLTGSIPASWADMLISGLNYLQLEDNRLVGPLPTTWGAAHALELLMLGGNNFDGPIPASLVGIKSLRTLSLSSNNLTGTLPTRLESNALTGVWLNGNQLTGTLPEWVAPNLRTWVVGTFYGGRCSGNKLSGPIPASLAKNSPRLRTLRLACNRLSGTLPSSIGNLADLTGLVLGYNAFSGTLPPTWGKLRQLTLFNVEHTHIAGTIPESFGALTNLADVLIAETNLSGCIPVKLAELPIVTRKLPIIKIVTKIRGPC